MTRKTSRVVMFYLPAYRARYAMLPNVGPSSVRPPVVRLAVATVEQHGVKTCQSKLN